MIEKLCPKCFRLLTSSTNTVVCLACKIKWRIKWQDGKSVLEEVKKHV